VVGVKQDFFSNKTRISDHAWGSE